MDSKHKTLLKIAESLIHKGWTRKNFATAPKGKACDPTSKTAGRWCAMGALECAANQLEQDQDLRIELMEEVKEVLMAAITSAKPVYSIILWNDDEATTLESVKRAFAMAVRICDDE